MSFPSSPTNGQQATLNGILYQYSSSEGTWTRIGTSISANISSSIDTVARTLANTAAANTIYTQGVDADQNTKIQAAFDKANTGGEYAIDNVARLTANSASSNTVIIQAVNVAQNTRITFVEGHSQAAFDQANLALQTDIAIQDEVDIIKNVNITQNTKITAVDSYAGGAYALANAANNLAQAAFNKANTGTTVSLGGFAANNVLTVNSTGYISNTTNLNFYSSNNTLVVTGNVVGGGIRSTSSATAPSNPVVGDIWYDTSSDVTYRYTNDGSNSYWIDISGPEISETLPSHRSIVEFVATANQNSFSTIYTVGSVDILRNGLRLSTSDYVANNGTSVILSDPCNANDIVTIINFYTTSLNVVLSANGRISGVANGTILWNTANNVLETYVGTGWTTLASQGFLATGGDITTSGNYKIHTFTSSGTFAVSSIPSTGSGTVEYLIVAGGGSGGDDIGAGGGGGGVLTGTFTPSVTNYSVVIGAGGAATTGTEGTGRGNNGSNTSIFGLTALGGGAGGGEGQAAGNSGGSGGGGGYPNGNAGGSGTLGQGYAGGSSSGTASGGGGGAGAVGVTSSSGAAGGSGIQSNIDGNNYYYAGGGGGSGWTGTPAAGNGGAGGGGGGGGVTSSYVNPGTGDTQGRNPGLNGNTGGTTGKGGNAGTNTGGGGGGSGETNSGYQSTSGAGGSGIVIIKYSI